MEQERYLQMFASEERHWWYAARRLIIGTILKAHLTKGKKHSILEVGCGTGGNLQLLSRFGEVLATEMNADARQLAEQRGVCRVADGALPDQLPFDRSFDLICLFDVLEHIDDDLASLQSLAAKLTSSGKLLLTVPAYQFLWSQLDVKSHHKRRYTLRQLLPLLKAAGLNVVYSSHFNTLLFPLILFVRLFNKTGVTECGTDVTVPPKFVNVVLKMLFSIERFFIPRLALPFGVSIVVLAQKPVAKV